MLRIFGLASVIAGGVFFYAANRAPLEQQALKPIAQQSRVPSRKPMPAVHSGFLFHQPQLLNFPVGYEMGTLAAGDLNGDSLIDLAVTSSFNGTCVIWMYPQMPGGSFDAPMSAATMDRCGVIAVADVNGDGNNDIITSDVHVLLSTPGGFSQAAYPASGGQMQVIDVDGDQDLDIVTVTTDSGMDVLYNDGTGTLSAPSHQDLPLGSYMDISQGDVNGDGRQDLVRSTGGTSWVFPKVSANRFHQLGYHSTRSRFANAIGDFNRDGRQDLAETISSDPVSVLISLQDQTGRLVPSVNLPTFFNPGPVEATDLDGDGLADLVVGHGSSFGFYLQGPAGLYPERIVSTGFPYAFSQTGAMIALDLDNDGYGDVVGGSYGGPLLIAKGHARYCQRIKSAEVCREVPAPGRGL
jgi:hypothetical protein